MGSCLFILLSCAICMQGCHKLVKAMVNTLSTYFANYATLCRQPSTDAQWHEKHTHAMDKTYTKAVQVCYSGYSCFGLTQCKLVHVCIYTVKTCLEYTHIYSFTRIHDSDCTQLCKLISDQSMYVKPTNVTMLQFQEDCHCITWNKNIEIHAITLISLLKTQIKRPHITYLWACDCDSL